MASDLSPWMKLVVASAGFLSDSYDLFVINMVLRILSAIYPITTIQTAAVSSSALAGAIFGQLFFSALADTFGRRVIFITTITCVSGGAILSALCFDHPHFNIITQLCLCQAIMGIGIGGEYPLSASVTSESSQSNERGTRLGLVFSAQGVGNLMASLIVFVLLAAGVSNDLTWRLAMAFGAVPGLATVYWRWRMHETEAFTKQEEREQEELKEEKFESGGGMEAGLLEGEQGKARGGCCRSFSNTVHVLSEYSGSLLAVSVSWMLFDISYYAMSLFSSKVLESIGFGSQQNLTKVALGAIILAALGLPGYYLAVFTVDRLGRRTLQICGFFAVGTIFIVMAATLDDLTRSEAGKWGFLVLFALTFLASNWGPNATTYVIPTELFPTKARATAHGIAAASGKFGAVIGSAGLKPLFAATNLQTVLYVCASVALLGSVWTWAMVDDRSGEDLVETVEEDAPTPRTAARPGRNAPVLQWIRDRFYNKQHTQVEIQ